MIRASESTQTGTPWEPGPEEVLLGIDLVDLVSSSMYVNPLTAYREYLQNAADSIDDARATGLLSPDSHGRVEIAVDSTQRVVRIRDNGAGVHGSEFLRRLTAFGASEKRGRQLRGLRGVGRLAGLGYCRELFFRSRSAADELIHEIRWDCRELRSLLRSNDFHGSLGQAIGRSTAHRAYHASGDPRHFFEVELRSVVRHSNDDLLNEEAIRDYLGQVAPVPFSRAFPFKDEIEGFLADAILGPPLHVFVNGVGPVQRPYSGSIRMREELESRPRDLKLVTIPAVDGGVAGKGWVVHHDYLGAIPRYLGVRGLRFRCGNLQVGDESTLDHVFVEPRFNAWSIGEFHIVDRRIVPNGRRDQFEQSGHMANVLNHLVPVVREIAARCRTQSQYRQVLRTAAIMGERIENGLAILRQGAISANARRAVIANLEVAASRLDRAARVDYLLPDDRKALTVRHLALRKRLNRAEKNAHLSKRLRYLSATKQRAYQEVFSAIYDAASDGRAARELVERALNRLRR